MDFLWTSARTPHPLGLPHLSPSDALKVSRGNCLARFSFGLFSLCRTLRIPVVLENPSTSWLWSLPGALALARLYNVRDVDVDFCAFGTPWRKRTRLRFCHLDLSGLQEARCSGRGICSFSKCPHKVLEGKDAAGRFWTHVAEPYPRGLCLELARAYKQALRNKAFRSLSKYMA